MQTSQTIQALENRKQSKDIINHELTALQNAANNIKGLTVTEYYFQDKRKTNRKYFLSYNGTGISPTLIYTELNIFILGMIKAKELLTNQ